MSSKQTQMGPSGPEKIPGYFSWRHRTNAEHLAAVAAYKSEHGPDARRRKAAEREADTLRVMHEQNVSRKTAQTVAKISRSLGRAVAR